MNNEETPQDPQVATMAEEMVVEGEDVQETQSQLVDETSQKERKAPVDLVQLDNLAPEAVKIASEILQQEIVAEAVFEDEPLGYAPDAQVVRACHTFCTEATVVESVVTADGSLSFSLFQDGTVGCVLPGANRCSAVASLPAVGVKTESAASDAVENNTSMDINSKKGDKKGNKKKVEEAAPEPEKKGDESTQEVSPEAEAPTPSWSCVSACSINEELVMVVVASPTRVLMLYYVVDSCAFSEAVLVYEGKENESIASAQLSDDATHVLVCGVGGAVSVLHIEDVDSDEVKTIFSDEGHVKAPQTHLKQVLRVPTPPRAEGRHSTTVAHGEFLFSLEERQIGEQAVFSPHAVLVWWEGSNEVHQYPLEEVVSSGSEAAQEEASKGDEVQEQSTAAPCEPDRVWEYGEAVTSLCLHNTTTAVAVGLSDGSVYLIQLDSSSSTAIATKQFGAVSHLAFYLDTHLIGASDRYVFVYQIGAAIDDENERLTGDAFGVMSGPKLVYHTAPLPGAVQQLTCCPSKPVLLVATLNMEEQLAFALDSAEVLAKIPRSIDIPLSAILTHVSVSGEYVTVTFSDSNPSPSSYSWLNFVLIETLSVLLPCSEVELVPQEGVATTDVGTEKNARTAARGRSTASPLSKPGSRLDDVSRQALQESHFMINIEPDNTKRGTIGNSSTLTTSFSAARSPSTVLSGFHDEAEHINMDDVCAMDLFNDFSKHVYAQLKKRENTRADRLARMEVRRQEIETMFGGEPVGQS